MKRSVKIGLGISFGIIFLSVIGLYLGLAYYYKNGFSYGTKINGISCTGKTPEQVAVDLAYQTPTYEGLRILSKDGKEYIITPDDVDLKCDFEKPVEDAYLNQNAMFWGMNLLPSYQGINIEPDVSYDKDKLYEIVSKLDLWKENIPEDKRKVEIKQNNNDGFVLVNQKTDILNEISTPNLVYEYFDNNETVLDLAKAGCYEDLPLTKVDEATIDLFDKLKSFQDCSIEYHIGDEVVNIGPGVIATFALIDENGDYILDDNGNIQPDTDKINVFMDAFTKKYSTYGSNRVFKTTEGRNVIVEGGTYGKLIDQEEETNFLLDAMSRHLHTVRTPIYSQDNTFKGAEDIGNTYIEIDMTTQHLYYYVDGALILDSDIVTGNLRLGHGTITGTYSVLDKARNVTLRGRDYESFVKFWIHVHRGIGIHDASWRHGKFGGEIYKTNGSHGCVNTRHDEVKQLWELVEIGTPVVLFY